jgi:hypothetical protein
MGIKLGVTAILTGLVALHIGNTIYTLYDLFYPELCNADSQPSECLFPLVGHNVDGSRMGQLRVFTSPQSWPDTKRMVEVLRLSDLDVEKEREETVEIKVTSKLRNNGTFFVHVLHLPFDFAQDDFSSAEWYVIRSAAITQYHLPQADTFKLVSETNNSTDSATVTPKKNTGLLEACHSFPFCTSVGHHGGNACIPCTEGPSGVYEPFGSSEECQCASVFAVVYRGRNEFPNSRPRGNKAGNEGRHDESALQANFLGQTATSY